MLDKLRTLTNGNPTRMKMYVELYLEAIDENLPMLKKANEIGDKKAIRTVAHTLKPLFTTVGFQSLWELANTIETNIDLAQDLEKVGELSSELYEQLVTSRKEVAQAL